MQNSLRNNFTLQDIYKSNNRCGTKPSNKLDPFAHLCLISSSTMCFYSLCSITGIKFQFTVVRLKSAVKLNEAHKLKSFARAFIYTII